MATIELEIRAGKPRADVIVITASQLLGLQQQHKALERYTPKELEKIKKELRDPEMLLNPVGRQPVPDPVQHQADHRRGHPEEVSPTCSIRSSTTRSS